MTFGGLHEEIGTLPMWCCAGSRGRAGRVEGFDATGSSPQNQSIGDAIKHVRKNGLISAVFGEGGDKVCLKLVTIVYR